MGKTGASAQGAADSDAARAAHALGGGCSGNRLGYDVGQVAFSAITGDRSDSEVPGAGPQILDDISLQADGFDVHGVTEMLGTRAVVDAVPG